ncbi:MAG: orotidine-5'-phosphate decarboxylase [Thermoplasmata archaeon]
MPPTFFARAAGAARGRRAVLCVGLDPDPDRRPLPLRSRGPQASLGPFLRGIVRATRSVAAAYKLQLASYLAHGAAGLRALEQVRASLGDGVLTILDGKASDVPSTMRLLRRAAFDRWRFDAVTATPWMGWDGIEALAEDPARGVFVVAHSSNAGSADLQDPPGARRPAWLSVLEGVRRLARRRPNVGAVVGATYPAAVARARRILGPRIPILLPGVGAQGGDLGASVGEGIGSVPGSLWVSSSRSILYASDGPDWAEAARREAERLADAITAADRPRPAGGRPTRSGRSRSAR